MPSGHRASLLLQRPSSPPVGGRIGIAACACAVTGVVDAALWRAAQRAALPDPAGPGREGPRVCEERFLQQDGRRPARAARPDGAAREARPAACAGVQPNIDAAGADQRVPGQRMQRRVQCCLVGDAHMQRRSACAAAPFDSIVCQLRGMTLQGARRALRTGPAGPPPEGRCARARQPGPAGGRRGARRSKQRGAQRRRRGGGASARARACGWHAPPWAQQRARARTGAGGPGARQRRRAACPQRASR